MFISAKFPTRFMKMDGAAAAAIQLPGAASADVTLHYKRTRRRKKCCNKASTMCYLMAFAFAFAVLLAVPLCEAKRQKESEAVEKCEKIKIGELIV